MPDAQLKELALLATERVGDAINSVGQLIDDPEQVSLFLHSVISDLVMSTAEFMHEHVIMKDGKTPSAEVCYFKVLATLAKCGDITTLIEIARKQR
jgi:hypothetical protein